MFSKQYKLLCSSDSLSDMKISIVLFCQKKKHQLGLRCGHVWRCIMCCPQWLVTLWWWVTILIGFRFLVCYAVTKVSCLFIIIKLCLIWYLWSILNIHFRSRSMPSYLKLQPWKAFMFSGTLCELVCLFLNRDECNEHVIYFKYKKMYVCNQYQACRLSSHYDKMLLVALIKQITSSQITSQLWWRCPWWPPLSNGAPRKTLNLQWASGPLTERVRYLSVAFGIQLQVDNQSIKVL